MRFNDYWKIPKNAKAYFSPKRERELKAKYGVWYTVHTVISVFIAFVPFVVFLLLSPVDAFHPTTSVGNLLGAIGAIIGLILLIIIVFVAVFSAFYFDYETDIMGMMIRNPVRTAVKLFAHTVIRI